MAFGELRVCVCLTVGEFIDQRQFEIHLAGRQVVIAEVPFCNVDDVDGECIASVDAEQVRPSKLVFWHLSNGLSFECALWVATGHPFRNGALFGGQVERSREHL